MNRALLTLSAVLFLSAASAQAWPFKAIDPLAQRDEWGLMHQCPGSLNPTDFEPRYHSRWTYYFLSGSYLKTHPAYVGSLQTALQRRGYYGGEIDGVYSDEVREAIARLQKNHSMRVTGTLTVAVRRALRLP